MNTTGAFPLFGMIFTGAQGVAAIAIIAATFLVAIILSMRLMLEGWLLALAMFILTPISSIVTFMRVEPMELYRAMGLTNEELAMAKQMHYTNPVTMLAWAIVGAAIGIGFALASRRSFFARRKEEIFATNDTNGHE
jgi:hypothetical protein